MRGALPAGEQTRACIVPQGLNRFPERSRARFHSVGQPITFVHSHEGPLLMP